MIVSTTCGPCNDRTLFRHDNSSADPARAPLGLGVSSRGLLIC